MISLDSLDIMCLDFIKFDIEGYELRAIEGASETLLRCKPVVYVEDNGRSEDFGIPRGAVLDYLEGIGMQCSHIIKNRDYVFTWT